MLRIDKTYTVVESQTLNNYLLNTTPQTTTVEYNKVKTLTFTNKIKEGQIKVVKVDKDENNIKLEGVKFIIKDNNGNVVDTLTTDKNGEAVSKKLRVDRSYTVVEESTLSTYILNTTPQTTTVEYNKVKTLTFTNKIKEGQIKVVKVDADYNNIKLQGVKFNILDNNGKLVDTIITDEKRRGYY